MNVLHVTTDTNIGGAGHHLLFLLQEYDKGSFHMEVALPIGSRLIPVFTAVGIECNEVGHIGDKSFSIKGIAALYKLIKKKRPHIVHTHASLSGRVAARLAGKCKIVYTRHSINLSENEKLKFHKMQISKFLNRFFADKIIAVTPPVKNDLIKTGAPAEKIALIYNGVPPVKEKSDVQKKEIRKKYGIPEGSFVIALIARLVELKGHDDVLDAAKAMMTNENIIFLFAGDGERHAHIQNRVKKEGISNVLVLGFVEEIDEIENIMDAQLNASFKMEACPVSLLKGMSLGTPTVASDCGGNPYVVTNGENGLIYPARNVDKLKAALLSIYTDKSLYNSLGAGAKERFPRDFTSKKMAMETTNMYKGLFA